MIIGTAGHIDHGKTALVRALTGVDTDRLPEEKRRGITIDLGFAPLALPGLGAVGVVDVPGHEAFVRTMVAGATGIDVALVVIAADEGVMPQTREHLAVLRLLGVRHAVVALTKRDLVDDDWLALATDDVRATIAATPFADAAIIPVSATTGAGLDVLRDALARALRQVPVREEAAPFRLPVDRAFTVRGTGTVVSGTVWSGEVGRDAMLRLMPGDRAVRVRGLHAFGQPVAAVRAGERAALALAGVELEAVGRGSVLVQGDAWRAARVLRADVTLLHDAPRPVGPRARVRLHLGTSDVAARIVVRGGALAPGAHRSARIVTDEPLVARAGDRFVLRAESPAATIGGGTVLDPHAPPRARPWPEGERSRAAMLDAMLLEAGSAGLRVADLPVRAGLDPAALDPASGWRVGARLLHPAAHEALRVAGAALVDAHHASHPLDDGMALGAFRARLGAPEEVASAVVDALVSNGLLEVAHGAVRRPGFVAAPAAADAELRDRLLAALEAAGGEPPTLAELAGALGAAEERLAALARFLGRRGILVPVERERFHRREDVDARIARLANVMAAGGTWGAGELREALGMSRKYLIPFLEHCDERGLTLRDADGRRRWAGAAG